MRSAAAFHTRITPSRSAKINASGAWSTRNETSVGVVLTFKASAPFVGRNGAPPPQHNTWPERSMLSEIGFGKAVDFLFEAAVDPTASDARGDNAGSKMVHLYLPPLRDRTYSRNTTSGTS